MQISTHCCKNKNDRGRLHRNCLRLYGPQIPVNNVSEESGTAFYWWVVSKWGGSERQDDLFFKSFVRYDDNHNELERLHYKSENVVKEQYEYKYEFDKYQNWIKKYEYKNGKAYRLCFREIAYC